MRQIGASRIRIHGRDGATLPPALRTQDWRADLADVCGHRAGERLADLKFAPVIPIPCIAQLTMPFQPNSSDLPVGGPLGFSRITRPFGS